MSGIKRTSADAKFSKMIRERDNWTCQPNGCWEWTGSRSPSGYGRVGRHQYAHRVIYEQQVGPIPEGLQIDHLCRNRACVNPAHLEPVTSRENGLRGMGIAATHARQTHCIHGHEFTPENTYLRPDRAGRGCKECSREQVRRRRRAGKR